MPASRARGQLESDVLQILWNSDQPLTAKEILEQLPGKPAAHTTVLTALDRLQRKECVVRVGEAARGIRFTAAQSESDFVSSSLIDRLSSATDRRGALMKFAGDLSAADLDILRTALGDSNGLSLRQQ